MQRNLLIPVGLLAAFLAVGTGLYFAWRNSNFGFPAPAPDSVSPTPDISVPGPGGSGISVPDGSGLGSGGFGTGTGSDSSGDEIVTRQGDLIAMSSKPVIDYWVAEGVSETKIFYLTEDREIAQVQGTQGQVLATLGDTFSRVVAAEGKGDGAYVLLELREQGLPAFTLYDLDSNVAEPLQDAVAASLSPDGTAVAVLKDDGSVLVQGIGDRRSSTAVLSLNVVDVSLDWVSDDAIMVISRPSVNSEGHLLRITPSTKRISLIASGNGLMTAWDKSASTGLLFTAVSSRQTKLDLIDAEGEVQATFSSQLATPTLPTKCFLLPPKLYCAFIQGYTSNTTPVLPDDYLKRAVFSQDAVYMLDLDDNSLEQLVVNGNDVLDMHRLFMTDTRLFFMNRYDNKLYALEIR